MTSAKRPFTTQQLDVLSKTVRSALVSDILDGLGLWHQCLAPGLVPLDRHRRGHPDQRSPAAASPSKTSAKTETHH